MANTVGPERRNSVPIIYTSGTFYEVGFDVGRTFQGLIQEFLASYKIFHEKCLPKYETPKGQAVYEAFLKNLKQRFPHYIRELQGTADGARVPFHHLMILHLDQSIIKSNQYDETTQGNLEKGCSTVCCNRGNEVVLGHTEDASPYLLNFVYLVSAKIKEKQQGHQSTLEEDFTALCYAGHLPGFCMGYNAHGLIFTVNVIEPITLSLGKTPRQFLTRTLLTARSLSEAEDILQDSGMGSADGFSTNMVFCEENMTRENYIFYNAEIGPAANSNESEMSLHSINPGQNYFHANKYLRLKIPEEPKAVFSSNVRHQRFQELDPPMSESDVIGILSDTKSPEYPLFREFIEFGRSETLVLGVFNILERTWKIWAKNPQNCSPVVSLPIILKNESRKA